MFYVLTKFAFSFFRIDTPPSSLCRKYRRAIFSRLRQKHLAQCVPAMHDRHVCNGTRGSVLHTFVFAFSANAKEASQSSLQRIAVDIMIGSHALSSPLKPRTFCALRPCLLADLPVCFCICNLKYTTFFPRLNSVFCKKKRKINNKNGKAR